MVHLDFGPWSLRHYIVYALEYLKENWHCLLKCETESVCRTPCAFNIPHSTIARSAVWMCLSQVAFFLPQLVQQLRGDEGDLIRHSPAPVSSFHFLSRFQSFFMVHAPDLPLSLMSLLHGLPDPLAVKECLYGTVHGTVGPKTRT